MKIAKSVEEAADLAGKILGMTLVTHQTGPEGRLVRRLLIEETLPIEKELYLAVLLDRATSRPVIMASTEGGMDIEEVAERTPEKIIRESIDPAIGIVGEVERVAFRPMPANQISRRKSRQQRARLQRFKL